MLGLIDAFFTSHGPALATVLVAAFVAVVGGREYQKRLQSDARAIVATYFSAIEVTAKSLELVRSDPDLAPLSVGKAPSSSVYDFRKEDWFAVHNQLCGDLGKLIHLDQEKGTAAIRSVTEFYEEVKFSRELFAFLVTQQRALAALQEDEKKADDVSTQIQKVIAVEKRMFETVEQAIIVSTACLKNLKSLAPELGLEERSSGQLAAPKTVPKHLNQTETEKNAVAEGGTS